jgi:hypothetical protein
MVELPEELHNESYKQVARRPESSLKLPAVSSAKVQFDPQELFESFGVDPSDVTPLATILVASIRSKDPPSIKYPIVFPISSDHLIHLVHYNVYRALVTNKQLVKRQTLITKLDRSSHRPNLDLCDGISFLIPKRQASLPSALTPTTLQMKVPHLPWLDMFPYPKLRDNLIARQYDFNQLDLCNDLCGEWFMANLGDLIAPPQPILDEEDDVTAGRTGLIVWGDSWDPYGWEVTAKFVRKWSWVLEGCEELFVSTNAWRAKRGLAPLDFEALRVDALSESMWMDGSGFEGWGVAPTWEELVDDQQGKVLLFPRITGIPMVSD